MPRPEMAAPVPGSAAAVANTAAVADKAALLLAVPVDRVAAANLAAKGPAEGIHNRCSAARLPFRLPI